MIDIIFSYNTFLKAIGTCLVILGITVTGYCVSEFIKYLRGE